MQTVTIQSNQITLPPELFQLLKGKKVEFVEYHEGVFIKPVSGFSQKNINISEIRQISPVHGDTDTLTNPAFLHTGNIKEDELPREIAILLYRKDKMTLGQASRLARMSQTEFQRLTAERQIPVHYGIADFESDIKTL